MVEMINEKRAISDSSVNSISLYIVSYVFSHSHGMRHLALINAVKSYFNRIEVISSWPFVKPINNQNILLLKNLGVKLRLIPSLDFLTKFSRIFHGISLLFELHAMWSFLVTMYLFKIMLDTTTKTHIIILSYPPLSSLVPLFPIWMLAKLAKISGKKIVIVVDIRDELVDNPYIKYVCLDLLIITFAEKVLFILSDIVVVATKGYENLYKLKYPQHSKKVITCYSGIVKMPQNNDSTSPLKAIGYFGNIYGLRRDVFETFMDKVDPRIDVHVYSGSNKWLMKLSRRYPNLHVFSPVYGEEYYSLLSRYSAVLLIITPGQGGARNIPYKLFDYIAYANVVIVIGAKGEAIQILEDTQVPYIYVDLCNFNEKYVLDVDDLRYIRGSSALRKLEQYTCYKTWVPLLEAVLNE